MCTTRGKHSFCRTLTRRNVKEFGSISHSKIKFVSPRGHVISSIYLSAATYNRGIAKNKYELWRNIKSNQAVRKYSPSRNEFELCKVFLRVSKSLPIGFKKNQLLSELTRAQYRNITQAV